MPYNVKISLPTGSTIFSMVNGEQKISAHFSCAELANTKGNPAIPQLVLNNDVYIFLHLLEEFRRWFNKPMKVNSFYRQKDYNKSVGGSSNSLHLSGLAMDWGISGHTEQQRQNVINKWKQICEKYGVKGGKNTYTYESLDDFYIPTDIILVGGINLYTNGYHLTCFENRFGYESFVVRDYRGRKGDW